jgi:hypothetical protein
MTQLTLNNKYTRLRGVEESVLDQPHKWTKKAMSLGISSQQIKSSDVGRRLECSVGRWEEPRTPIGG